MVQRDLVLRQVARGAPEDLLAPSRASCDAEDADSTPNVHPDSPAIDSDHTPLPTDFPALALANTTRRPTLDNPATPSALRQRPVRR